MSIISKERNNLVTLLLSHLATSAKSAFTLAEILLTIVIIGVISAITLGILKNSIPTKEESIHKKMNSVVEQIVSRLIDNEVMYPETEDKTIVGFQNTNKVTVDGIDYEGDTKFCELFAAQFTTATDVSCVADERTFATTDNVDWFLPVTDFSDGYAMIMIDVNGKDEGNNCLEGACKNPDRFIYYVRANGTVTTKKPNAGEETKHKVNLTVINPQGGTYAIAEYKPEGTTYGEELSSASYTFTDLKNSTMYILRATPTSEYTNKWQEKDETSTSTTYSFMINGADKNITLTFNPKPKYCIIMQVQNCYGSSLSSCISTPVVNNTSSGVAVNMDKLGMPVYNETTGDYDANLTSATKYTTFVCGLSSGNYTVTGTTERGYLVSDGTTSYTRSVSLGSANQTIQLILQEEQQEEDPCKDMPGTTYNPSTGECECPPGYEWDQLNRRCVGSGSGTTYTYVGDVDWNLICDYDLHCMQNYTDDQCLVSYFEQGTLSGISSDFSSTVWDSTHKSTIANEALNQQMGYYSCPISDCGCVVNLRYTNIKINGKSLSDNYDLGGYTYHP